MSSTNTVQDHYSIPNLSSRIETAMELAGYGMRPILWQDLAALDQFHTRGLAATKELAEGLNLTEGDIVLDAGSGLGGPARYLAAVYECHVTGIELTPLYVEIAEMLSLRTGLDERTRFVQGDALDTPFAPECFDHAITQHVAMNIPNKGHLYKELYRVLRKGGRLAIYDVLKAGSEPVIYPVPWAFDPAISFLALPSELKRALEAAGFRLVSLADTTDQALAWFGEMQKAPPATALNLGAIIGPGVQTAMANLARNMKEGRVQVMQAIAQKD